MRDEIAEPPNIELKRRLKCFPLAKKPDQPVDSRITMCAQDLAHTNYIHLNQTNSHTHTNSVITIVFVPGFPL